MAEDNSQSCAGCAKSVGGETGVKALKCSRCKKVCYCSADCQRGDWKFHKRICVDIKEEEKKKKEKEEREKKEKEQKADEKKSAPIRPKKHDVVVDSDDDIGDWYRHRETKLPKDERSAPQKLADPPQNATGMEQSTSSASAWNAGKTTFEEKDVTARCQEEFKAALEKVVFEDMSHRYTLEAKSCTGDASAGTSRKGDFVLFDLHWEARIQRADLLALDDKSKYGKVRCADFSNASDDEMQLVFEGRVETKDVVREGLTKAISKLGKSFPQMFIDKINKK